MAEEWATTVHRNPDALRQHSLHRNQLANPSVKVIEIRINMPDDEGQGEKNYSFVNTRSDPRLKLYITGGTDNPAIELHLRIGDGVQSTTNHCYPPKDTMVAKYPLLEHRSHKGLHMAHDRVPANVEVPEDGDLSKLPLPEVADFTDMCHRLRWERDGNQVVLSWRARRTIQTMQWDVGSSDAAADPMVDQEMLQFFKRLRTMPEYGDQTVKVFFQWHLALELKYRYILNMPTDLKAFWRSNVVLQTQLATVPLHLSEENCPRSTPGHRLNALRPSEWTKIPAPRGSTALSAKESLIGTIVSINPQSAFASTMEAEYYIKTSYLAELDVVEETNQRWLNGAWPYQIIDVSEVVPGAPPRQVAFVIQIDISDCGRDKVTMPSDRDAMRLIWIKEDEEDGKQTTESWNGKVIDAPVHVKFDGLSYNTAVLVEQPLERDSAKTLLTRGFVPYFVFDPQRSSTKQVFNFIDRVLFGCVPLGLRPNSWIRNLLMGTHNHYPAGWTPLAVDRQLLAKMTCRMDESQRYAILAMQTSPMSLVIGPPGTGKTTVTSTHALCCVASNKRVIIVAQSNIAVQEILNKCIMLARRFHWSEHEIDQFLWNKSAAVDNIAAEGWDLRKVIQEEDNTDPDSHFGWLKTSVYSSIASKEEHPHVVRNMVLRDMKEIIANDWTSTKDDKTVYVLRHLFECSQLLKAAEEKRASPPATMGSLNSAAAIAATPLQRHEPSRTFDKKKLRKALAEAWQEAIFHYISHNCTILFTTFGSLPSKAIRKFHAQVLLMDEIYNTTDVNVWMAFSRCSDTLERASGVGDPAQLVPYAEGHGRSFMSQQIILDPATRMENTGIKPVRLNQNYRNHEDISAPFIKHVYTEKGEQLLFNHPSTQNRPDHARVKTWFAQYLGKDLQKTKVSAFVSVNDGRCCIRTQGTSKVNFHNLVAITDALQSLLDFGFSPADIQIICFYSETVVVLKRLLRSLGMHRLVKQVCSVDASQGSESKLVLVDMCTTACNGDPLGFLNNLNRMNVAISRAKEGQLIFGHKMMTRGEKKFSKCITLMRDIIATSTRDGQMKEVFIGQRLQGFFEMFQPQLYHLASSGLGAETIFR